MPQSHHEWLLSRVDQLKDEGRSVTEAWQIADLESRINSWPEAWGGNLVCWLYGPIEVVEPTDFPELGIHIENERQKGQFVFGTPWAYKAIIKVPSKDVKGVLEGIERLEKLLGAWHVVSWGRTIHYYCPFFQGGGDVLARLDGQEKGHISTFLNIADKLQVHEQQLLYRAIWWLRFFHRSGMSGDNNPSVFAQYMACWNALEVLARLLNRISPADRLTRPERDQQIADYFKSLGRVPNVEELAQCYRRYVDPGIRPLISRSFDICFGVVGLQYTRECFEQSPRERRLYQIRNDINHGNISEYDHIEKRRVEMGLSRLRLIVLDMFLLLTGQSVMVDTDIDACHTCLHLDESRSCTRGLLPNDQVYWRFVCQSYSRKGT